MEFFIAELHKGSKKKILSYAGNRDYLMKCLKQKQYEGEIDSYLVYTKENWFKFREKSVDK